MKPAIHAYLCDDTGHRFFGNGPMRLLQLIGETGSLRCAAQQMGLAFHVFDLREAFRRTVIEPFTEVYRQGNVCWLATLLGLLGAASMRLTRPIVSMPSRASSPSRKS